MYCGSCGNEVSVGAKFCQNCGAPPRAVGSRNDPPVQPVRNRLPIGKFALALMGVGLGIVVLLVLFGIFVRARFKEFEEGARSSQEVQSDIQSSPSGADSKQVSPEAAKRASAQSSLPSKPNLTPQQLRNAYAVETQKELWRQGTEMTFEAHGTTLNVEYVLAGKAFVFQFGETFIGPNRDTLRALGFKRVVLSDGNSSDAVEAQHEWTWDLTK